MLSCGAGRSGKMLIVHHIDGNKRNNDPSNLAVMTQSEHCRIHFKKAGDENHEREAIRASE